MIEHDPDLSAPSGSVVIEMDGADSQSVFPVLQQPKSIPTVVQQQPLPALMQLMSTVIQTSAVDEDMEQKSLAAIERDLRSLSSGSTTIKADGSNFFEIPPSNLKSSTEEKKDISDLSSGFLECIEGPKSHFKKTILYGIGFAVAALLFLVLVVLLGLRLSSEQKVTNMDVIGSMALKSDDGKGATLAVNKRKRSALNMDQIHSQQMKELRYLCADQCTCSSNSVVCSAIDYRSFDGKRVAEIFSDGLPFYYTVQTLEIYGGSLFPGLSCAKIKGLRFVDAPHTCCSRLIAFAQKCKISNLMTDTGITCQNCEEPRTNRTWLPPIIPPLVPLLFNFWTNDNNTLFPTNETLPGEGEYDGKGFDSESEGDDDDELPDLFMPVPTQSDIDDVVVLLSILIVLALVVTLFFLVQLAKRLVNPTPTVVGPTDNPSPLLPRPYTRFGISDLRDQRPKRLNWISGLLHQWWTSVYNICPTVHRRTHSTREDDNTMRMQILTRTSGSSSPSIPLGATASSTASQSQGTRHTQYTDVGTEAEATVYGSATGSSSSTSTSTHVHTTEAIVHNNGEKENEFPKKNN